MKLKDILNLNQVLKIIIDDREAKIDSLLKFKLLGIMKSIEPMVGNFEIIKNEKIKEYGKITDDGYIQIDEDDLEAIEKFNADINKLVNDEVIVDINKIKSSDIFNKGLTADYLVALYPIIEEN